jgi:hypothetical protein
VRPSQILGGFTNEKCRNLPGWYGIGISRVLFLVLKFATEKESALPPYHAVQYYTKEQRRNKNLLKPL